MEKRFLSMRTKSWLAVVLFAAVFAGLAVIASFYDLEISKLLTKHSLEPAALGANGEYISHNGFALFFEAMGCTPLYVMGAIVGLVWFWAAWRKGGKWRIVACLSAVLPVVAFTLLFKDAFAYVAEYIGAQLGDDSAVIKAHEAAGSGYILGISVVLAMVGSAGAVFAWGKVDPKVNNKMVWWTFAIIGTALCMLIINFVKSPVGRVRFRTMNYLNDFSYYTPWYVINGKRVVIPGTPGQVVASNADTKALAILASDTCKSFPSGHTYSAAMIYCLLALPFLDERLNKKWIKLVLWCGTIALTGIIAISRIVAGAHFMSDVLFGGSICFAASMIMREIFVCRGSHFKAMFGIKGKEEPKPEEQAAPQEEQAEEPQAEEAEPQEEPKEVLPEGEEPLQA